MNAIRIVVLSMSCFLVAPAMATETMPLRIGVIGLTHTHVHWIFDSEKRGDIEIVGIVEADTALARRYSEQYGFPMEAVYPTMQALVEAERPVAVAAFGSTLEHLEVVENAAPLGIHVMVEKPLAVSLEHARKMRDLAVRHGIHLLVNYETTWYPTTYRARELLRSGEIGDVRKIIVRDGHRGPVKLGINDEFLDWLQDPARNGGGALVDFGCYGANLVTWLMDGERPLRVTAVAEQFQPENNPRVEDEATIILVYESAQAIVQASWNWPIGRKDMEIYGLDGVIYADNGNDLRIRYAEGYDGFEEASFELPDREAPYDDPFSYFKGVIEGSVKVEPGDLSALGNNLVVMEILDAARESARTGRTIELGARE
jgi:predicted dehydrogenase